jgi:hypothetical protein
VAQYEVYATAWNDPHVVEELIPARGLQFSMPLSGHGECSFSATVEPGSSFWRPSIAPAVSGVLVARDGVPVWQGWVTSERESDGRTFEFSCVEWGGFFERVPAVAKVRSGWNDHAIFRDLITTASAIQGQDPKIVLGSTSGASASDWTINAWDDKWVASEFTDLGNADGGPEWYFGSAGTLDNPQRVLVLGDRLGDTSANVVLEYVEDTEDPANPYPAPHIALLGNLFPAGTSVPAIGRRGGNVIAKARTRETSSSATATIAYGAGSEKAQIRATAQANRLLNAGWPRITKSATYSDVSVQATLNRHASADLAASAGIVTGYSLVTLDGEPDWTQVPRGSTVRVILDTDVYGSERPVGGDNGFTSRLLGLTVNVDDDGPAQIQWDTATVLDDL